MSDYIITLVHHPGTDASHLLSTPPDTLHWRRTAALCGAVPPETIGWQPHHSARLPTLCPVCLHALVEARRLALSEQES